MSSINKIVAAVACLATTALAFPASSPYTVSARQSDTDCSAGLVFYSCANGYRGCFTSDPCALPPLQDTPTTTETTVDDTPAPESLSCPADAAVPARYYEPEMYNLWGGDLDYSQPDPVSYISVLTDDTHYQLQQAMVFRGIPANAKSCSLGWDQADFAERVFNVTINGSVRLTQLNGFPAEGEPVSVNSITALKSDNTFTADFTNWDKVGDSDHSTGAVFDCAEELSFQLEINLPNDPRKWGSVYMEQDFQNGFYLSYTC